MRQAGFRLTGRSVEGLCVQSLFLKSDFHFVQDCFRPQEPGPQYWQFDLFDVKRLIASQNERELPIVSFRSR